MNVLSLFDGMSCGQQALERIGIKVDNYYASEIDKYAITVTMANYPNTIQLGSVVNVDIATLPKIDLLIGGSPCQSFSFAGKRKGMSTKDNQEILTLEHYLQLKSKDYEFEGQSYLFWEYMRVLNVIKQTNPNVLFLLENVIMAENWEKVLSKAIGVKPIEINSALVSAQNRRRLYWTNIGLKPSGLFGDLESIIQQPKDKGILLKDILQDNVDERFYLSEKSISKLNQHNSDDVVVHTTNGCLVDSYSNGVHHDKSICITTRISASNCVHICERKVNQINNSKESGGQQPFQQNRVYDINGITPALCANKAGLIISGGDIRSDKGFRERENGKIGTLLARARTDESCGQVVKMDTKIRRLTPTECERLQTIKDNYTNHVSDSQRYKMLGNGWTVDVIAHIFYYITN